MDKAFAYYEGLLETEKLLRRIINITLKVRKIIGRKSLNKLESDEILKWVETEGFEQSGLIAHAFFLSL